MPGTEDGGGIFCPTDAGGAAGPAGGLVSLGSPAVNGGNTPLCACPLPPVGAVVGKLVGGPPEPIVPGLSPPVCPGSTGLSPAEGDADPAAVCVPEDA